MLNHRSLWMQVIVLGVGTTGSASHLPLHSTTVTLPWVIAEILK